MAGREQDSEFYALTNVAEVEEKSSSRTIKPFTVERAQELADLVRMDGGEYLPSSFKFTIQETETFWKIIATTDNGFRGSAILNKKKTFEQRMNEALAGLLLEYWYSVGEVPRRWAVE